MRLSQSQTEEQGEEEAGYWWRSRRSLRSRLIGCQSPGSNMTTTALGKSQKSVLYADVSYPELTDSELSKIVGISPGRISTIRSQLIREEFYREMKIPALDLLGFEGIGAVMVDLKEAHTSDDSSHRKMVDDLCRGPGVLYAVEGADQLMILTAFPRLSLFEGFADECFEVGCRISNSDCEELSVSFPFDISTISSFWDFSSVLHDRFGVNIPLPNRHSPPIGKSTRRPNPSIDEIRMLDLMIRDPVGNDADLATRADVGLSTFRRTKERIISQGLCKRAFVPEISKMGFELVVFSLLRLNPCRMRPGEVDKIKSLVSPWPFILISRKSKALIGHCFSNYTNFERYSSRVLKELKKGSIHMDTIKTISYSTAGMREIKPLDFSGLLSTLVQMESSH